MGTNSALMTKKVIDNTFEVLSIEFITIIQAVDYLKIKNKLGKQSQLFYNELRKLVPVFTEDTPKYKEIEVIKQYLMKSNPKVIK